MRPLWAMLGLLMAAHANAMTFRYEGNGGNCEGCAWVAADGEISFETPQQFQKFLAEDLLKLMYGEEMPLGLTIYLNSPGGDLMAGIKLGELIRAQGFDAAVGKSVPSVVTASFRDISEGTCASACAYAFLGGVSRTAKQGEIGVHQFYNDATIKGPSGKLLDAIDLSVNQLISALVIDYVFRMGADPRIVSIASSTLPGEMHFFTEKELEELKVNWSPASFEPWAIEPYGSGVVAYSKTRDKKETATFFCRRDKIPRLLITAPIFKDATQLQEAINSLGDGLEAMGMKLPKEAASVRMVDGSPALEIQLTGLDFRNLNLVNDFEVRGSLPRVNAAYFYHPIPAKDAVPSLRVAAHNCL
jgi:hypothetical protein